MDIVAVDRADAVATEAAAAAVLATPAQPVYGVDPGAIAGPPIVTALTVSGKKRKAKSVGNVENEDEAKRFLSEIGADVATLSARLVELKSHLQVLLLITSPPYDQCYVKGTPESTSLFSEIYQSFAHALLNRVVMEPRTLEPVNPIPRDPAALELTAAGGEPIWSQDLIPNSREELNQMLRQRLAEVFGTRRIFTEGTTPPCFWPESVKFERPGRHSIPDARAILMALAEYQNVMRSLRQLQLDFARPIFVRGSHSQQHHLDQHVLLEPLSPRKALLSPLNALSSTPAVSRQEWAEVREACRVGDSNKLQHLVAQGVLVMRKAASPPPPPAAKPPPVAVTAALTSMADASGAPARWPLLTEPVALYPGEEARRALGVARRTLESMQPVDAAREALAVAAAQLETSLIQGHSTEALRRLTERIVDLERTMRAQLVQVQVAITAISTAYANASQMSQLEMAAAAAAGVAPSPQKL